MKVKDTLLILLPGVCSLIVFSNAWAWQTNVNGTANSFDEARAVTVDGAGNVIAAGTTRNTGTAADFTVIKFDGTTGQELWRQAINGTANADDMAVAAAVDGSGNVIAAGFITNTGSPSDFTVIKFDGASGEEMWRHSSARGAALAVTIDGEGNVVAAGVTDNSGTDDFTVVKFDGASGQELWRQVVNGSANAYDQARAVAVDSAGNVVAAGITSNSGSLIDFTVIKFDGASGGELWRQAINGTANLGDDALAIAVDASGNVVAAGYTTSIGPTFDFTVVKFNGASGDELWRKVINGSANDHDVANAATVDAVGNVVATGYIRNSGVFNDLDFTVIKFDGATGEELWRQAIDGTRNSSDNALAVAVDSAGDVVAAGWTSNIGTSGDFTVIKFDGASGGELWRQAINGTASQSDQAVAVTIDGEGNVVAVGDTFNTGTLLDFTVVKLRGTDGSDF